MATKEKRDAAMVKYRASPKGREKIREASARLSEKRRLIAVAKAGIAVVKPGEFDGSAVQRTLNIWGGL